MDTGPTLFNSVRGHRFEFRRFAVILAWLYCSIACSLVWYLLSSLASMQIADNREASSSVVDAEESFALIENKKKTRPPFGCVCVYRKS
jgi:hypothetical protein